MDRNSIHHTVSNGTSYDLRIRAESKDPNQDGTDSSHYRYSSWVTLSNLVPGLPGKTTGLSVTAGAGKLDLSWTAPANNGSAITGYDVHYKTSAAADQAGTGSDPTTGWVAATHSGTPASGSIPSLTAGTAYDVRVRAKNTHGAGEWSDAQSGTPQVVQTLTLTVPAATSLSEAAGSRTVTVTATLSSAAGSGGVTVNISAASGATATGGGVDYSLASTITIASGNTTGTATLTVVDDSLMEGTETIALDASSTSPSVTAQTLYENISDDDSATFSFSSATYSVAEASSNVTLTLTVNVVAGTLGTAVNGLGVATTDGTAMRGTDYQTPTSTAGFEIDFSAGDSSKDAAITILGDTTSETDESFTVALELPDENALPISIGTPGTATVTITEESSNANLSGLTASTSTMSGGTYSALDIGTFSASTTSYTATVPNATTHAKLTPTVEDTGKATVTVDGTTVTSGSASGAIALNQGVNAITVRVTAEDSTTKDYTVTITREASSPETPTVRLSASPNPVAEGSTVTVTATLSATLSSQVVIPVTLTDDTAEPDDHGTLADITIASGATSGTGTITTAQDADEEDETFTVALGNLPASVAAGTPSSVQVRIRDDDGGGDPPDPPDPPDPTPVPALPFGGVVLIGLLLAWRGAVRVRRRGV